MVFLCEECFTCTMFFLEDSYLRHTVQQNDVDHLMVDLDFQEFFHSHAPANFSSDASEFRFYSSLQLCALPFGLKWAPDQLNTRAPECATIVVLEYAEVSLSEVLLCWVLIVAGFFFGLFFYLVILRMESFLLLDNPVSCAQNFCVPSTSVFWSEA